MGFRKHGDGRVLSEDGGTRTASTTSGLTPEALAELKAEDEQDDQ